MDRMWLELLERDKPGRILLSNLAVLDENIKI
jgi:hypothetical protein